MYGRTRSQTGGLLQIWLLKRLASLIALQPILLGLILLTRRIWPEGSALIVVGVVIIIFVKVYTRIKERQPGRGALSPVALHALESFRKAAQPDRPTVLDEESTSLVSSGRGTRTRGSFASVLEMMTTTLAVVPTHYQQHGPVPIRTFSPFLSRPVRVMTLARPSLQRPKRWTISRRPSVLHARIPMHRRGCLHCHSPTTRKRCQGFFSRPNSSRRRPSSGCPAIDRASPGRKRETSSYSMT